MRTSLYAVLMVAVCLMVSVDARPGKKGRRGPSSESGEPSSESGEPSSVSGEPSSEESGPRSGERRGRGPAPFGVSHEILKFVLS